MIISEQRLDENPKFFTNQDINDRFYSESSTKYKVKTFIDEFSAKEKNKFINQFKRLLDESDFEYGFSSPADKYIQESLKNFGPFAREWINEIFIQNLDNEYITSSILKVMMHLNYSDLEPQGITMLLAALNHKSAAVREDVIRTFENWENPAYVSILKSLNCKEPWLQTMLSEVIEYLESL